MAVGFGPWLKGQKGRDDWVGRLAGLAARDPAFPRRATPELVRAHLSRHEAEADLHEALDDAEREWLRAAA